MYFENTILIYTIPIWIIIRFFLCLRAKKYHAFSFKREILVNILFVYILCVVSITFFPMYFSEDSSYLSVNFIPVWNTIKELISIRNSNIPNFMILFWGKNIAGNMLLLLPLGFLVPILWQRFQDGRKMILFTFCFSLSIELMQLLLMYIGLTGRAFDVDDIILNTLGGCIGYFLYKKLLRERMVKK